MMFILMMDAHQIYQEKQGASSQQEIREHFNLIIQEMMLFWAGLLCICIIQPFSHFLSSVSFILVTTVRGKHIKEHLAWTYVNISNNAVGGRSNNAKSNSYHILSAYYVSDISPSVNSFNPYNSLLRWMPLGS